MTKTVTLDVGAYFEGLDHLGVVKKLLAEPGVQDATSSPASASVTVRFDEGVTSVPKLRKVIEACGQQCRGEATPRYVCVPTDMPAPTTPAAAKPGGAAGTGMADVLPGQKADKVKELQAQGNKVGMVGDGVNDAPALTQADVGFAIGAGTDVAMESADVVLMKSDTYDVVGAIVLSRATLRKMHQNLFWAVGYNVIAFPAAAGVFFPFVISPEAAALAMSGNTALLAVNARLLKRTRLEGIAKATIRTQPAPALS